MFKHQQALLNIGRGLLMGLLLALLILPVIQAKTLEPVVLSSQADTFSAVPYTEYFEDKSHSLLLANFLNSNQYPFTAANKQQNQLAFGRSQSAWWVRFSLINQTEADWYLLIDSLVGDEFEIFVFPAGFSNQAITPQLIKSYAVNLQNYPRRSWHLSIPKNQLFNVYIRATNGNAILNMPLELLSADKFIMSTFDKYRLVSLVFAGILVLATYQFLMFLVLREASYIILAVYMLSVMLTIHRSSPLFSPLFFLSDTNAYFFTAPFLIAIATSAAYTRDMLNTAYYAQKLDWIFKAFIVVALVALFTLGAIPLSTIFPPVLTLLLIGFTFFASLYVASKGSRLGLYFTLIFLIPLGIYLPSLSVLIWKTELWRPEQDILFSFGILLFMLLLSIIQAERVRVLREQVVQVELASKAKDEFLAVMSHELRTPMNAVVGLGALLKLTKLSDTQKVYINKLDIATQHMMQLISNVLDFAKFRNTNFKLLEEPFSLMMVLNSVAALIEQQTEDKNLNFKLDISGSVEDKLLGDRLHLTQVLFNLLNNAIKYTEQGSITLKIVTKNKTHGQLNVIFKVMDTGRGIDTKDLVRLFEPFVQVRPSSIQKREGVGLGLAISKRLVDIMGGSIKVDSVVGKGSKFIVELNFKLVLIPLDETQSPLASAGRKRILPQAMQVLLIDDSELSRLVASAMLRELGAKVLAVENSSQAEGVLKQQRIDIIILDMGCLEQESADSLAVLHQSRDIPFIGVLAKQSAPLAEAELIDVYLSKPFDYEDLHAVLLKALNLRQTSLPTV